MTCYATLRRSRTRTLTAPLKVYAKTVAAFAEKLETSSARAEQPRR